ncbi:MAG TPA: thioredoxin domain-containing protein [Dehalococcoidia bacterium]|jgi:protein-disulfide isomerase|nr:thioredoxin domain-containing protein [Dehalococcoidia bacterium]
MSNQKHPSQAARSRQQPHNTRGRRLMVVLSLALVAVLAAGALVAFQTSGSSGSATVPPKTAASTGRTLGDPNAPVTVVEYADFQCPICKRAETDVIARLEQDYVNQGKVKIEFRDFAFIGQDSWNAAQAALAANDQGKFWQYHDALFNAQGQENSGQFSYDNLVKIAQQVGLDVPTFEKTLSSNTHLAEVQQEVDQASKAGVDSTPTFFIGEKKIVGIQSYSQFQSAINAALNSGGATS